MHFLEKLIYYLVRLTIKRSKKTNVRTNSEEELKILLVGYSGKRNTGAEVRSAEIIKQLRNMRLSKPIHIGVLTLNPEESKSYYPKDIQLIPMSSIFFKDLLNACNNYDAAILAEGSCFTSVTSNIAALFFICTAAIMKAQYKCCIAYGVETGPMPTLLIKLTKKYCDKVYFIARTEESLKNAINYGINATLGTDTAWTVQPCSMEWAKKEIRKKWEWDINTPLIGISAMNAFIRPIQPKIYKYIRSRLNNQWNSHYEKIYFYSDSKERKLLYQNYLHAIVRSIKTIQSKHKVIPVFIEMEPMDEKTYNDLKNMLNPPFYYFSAKKYNGEEMTALLMQLSLLLTSRYHAHVLSMLGGVPCVAITKDQRLTSIFLEHNLSELCVLTHDKDIINKLGEASLNAWNKRELIKQKLLERLPYYFLAHEEMGRMVETFFNQSIQ